MKASTLTMRIDPVLKEQAEELCEEMGNKTVTLNLHKSV